MDKAKRKITGAVMVQGGGIAGVQASLDLANSGFRVYLAEESPAIGGMMAHLDKTFPTGDCATCIVSPKLVECSRNLNIEIHTLSTLEKLEGEAGNFKAYLKKSPRYINEKICNDCGDCVTACPVEIRDDFNRGLGTRKAVQKYSAQAIPNRPAILKLGHAPCKMKCPANVNVQGYIQLIKKREYVKAVNLIRERNPLAAVCGRVCPAPCESACTRGSVDSPIAIRELKRFASDKEIELVESGALPLPSEKTPPAGAKRVAIVGAGPSGLTAADDLAGRGYAVTVYEAEGAAGGMLRWGIPEYRLPEKILDYEVDLIRRKGVTFVYNCRIGTDINLDELRGKSDALFLGIGTQKNVDLSIPGRDLKGVESGLDFLHKVNSRGKKPALRSKVIVIGGGDVAMDAACCALRLGSESVTVVYRRSAAEMPANRNEIEKTAAEGVEFQYLTNPIEFMGDQNGVLQKIKCIKMSLGKPDESGRRSPVPIEGSEFEIRADTVILAIGSEPDKSFSDGISGLSVNKRGNIIINDFGASGMDGVFSGGDIVTGPATVIEAVAAGKLAAESIDLFLLNGRGDSQRFRDTLKPVPEDLLPSVSGVEKKARAKAKELDAVKRISNFQEIEACFSVDEAVAESGRCLNCALCSECNECVDACDKNAIDHSMKEEMTEIDVGSVILAPGIKEFDAARKGEYGFNRYRNVITSVQFERMLSAAGPSAGHVVRRDDGKEARRIAWIQCVGSRDAKCGKEYCSSICCMATTKQALTAAEHAEGLEATIFYMDIRAFGKDFDQYYERARSRENIEYIKSIPSRVIQVPGSMDIRLRYYNEKFEQVDQDFDLVVLAVGLEARPGAAERFAQLGVELNEFGFCKTDRFTPLGTSRPGVFVAGAFQEPKDIPETVTQASAAASLSMELLAQARNSLMVKKKYPVEHDTSDEEPRIGVFVCHCGINISSTVDVEKVTQAIAGYPNVVIASHTMYTCSDSSLSEIKKCIEEHRLNRVVVASCTPRTHEDLFRETLREAGLNPYLFELANIRDQCSWVHSTQPEAATEKAIELVRMSVARAGLLRPLTGESLEVNQSGLVIGGGLSGMTAALSLADQGFKVSLVENSKALGGQFLKIHSTLELENTFDIINGLIRRVENHRNIGIYLNSEVARIKGHIGNFVVTVSTKESGNDKGNDLACGAIIVATGAEPATTGEYLYGRAENILTQIEMEHLLNEGRFEGKGKNIVMIQCVGSRNDERPYCSRLCCSMAVKNALAIKKKDPDANIYVLYRDIRTYGFREKYYQQARNAGIIFLRYDKDNPPVITNDRGLVVGLNSPELSERIEIETDFAVLSIGISAPAGNRRLSDLLKLQLNSDGFFLEAHLKLRPVDFATEGIYLCGLAHSPKMADENIAQARAAASRAATVLSKTHLAVGAQVSVVDQDRCISCMTCVHACPYGAPFVNIDGKGEIAAAKCMGCGICASECPARAIQLNHFESRQFEIMLENLLGNRPSAVM